MFNVIKRALKLNETSIQIRMNRVCKCMVEETLDVLTSFKCETRLYVDINDVIVYVRTLEYKKPEIVCALYRKASEFGNIGNGDFVLSF